jgi:hypothetical protein
VIAREVPQNVFPSLSTPRKTQFAIGGEPVDCVYELRDIFRLDEDAGAGFFEDLSRLTIHAKNHWAGTGHELQHLGRDDSFEDVSLFQENQAGVGCRNEGRDFFSGLLVEKTQGGSNETRVSHIQAEDAFLLTVY